MSRWVRLDADYFSNPKAEHAGLHGRALHLASICWSGQHLQDGLIPGHMVRKLCGLAGVNRQAVDKVVDAGLWLPLGSNFQLKDFTDFNQSRAQHDREREEWKLRQRKHRDPGS